MPGKERKERKKSAERTESISEAMVSLSVHKKVDDADPSRDSDLKLSGSQQKDQKTNG